MPSTEVLLTQRLHSTERDIAKLCAELRAASSKANAVNRVKKAMGELVERSRAGGGVGGGGGGGAGTGGGCDILHAERVKVEMAHLVQRLDDAQRVHTKKEEMYEKVLLKKNEQVVLLLKKEKMMLAKLTEKHNAVSLALRQLAEERARCQKIVELRNAEIDAYRAYCGPDALAAVPRHLAYTEHERSELEDLAAQLMDGSLPAPAAAAGAGAGAGNPRAVACDQPPPQPLSHVPRYLRDLASEVPEGVVVRDTVELVSSAPPAFAPSSPQQPQQQRRPPGGGGGGGGAYTPPRVSRLLRNAGRAAKEKQRDVLRYFPPPQAAAAAGAAATAGGAAGSGAAASAGAGAASPSAAGGGEACAGVPPLLQLAVVLESVGLARVLRGIADFDAFSHDDAKLLEGLRLFMDAHLSNTGCAASAAAASSRDEGGATPPPPPAASTTPSPADEVAAALYKLLVDGSGSVVFGQSAAAAEALLASRVASPADWVAVQDAFRRGYPGCCGGSLRRALAARGRGGAEGAVRACLRERGVDVADAGAGGDRCAALREALQGGASASASAAVYTALHDAAVADLCAGRKPGGGGDGGTEGEGGDGGGGGLVLEASLAAQLRAALSAAQVDVCRMILSDRGVAADAPVAAAKEPPPPLPVSPGVDAAAGRMLQMLAARVGRCVQEVDRKVAEAAAAAAAAAAAHDNEAADEPSQSDNKKTKGDVGSGSDGVGSVQETQPKGFEEEGGEEELAALTRKIDEAVEPLLRAALRSPAEFGAGGSGGGGAGAAGGVGGCGACRSPPASPPAWKRWDFEPLSRYPPLRGGSGAAQVLQVSEKLAFMVPAEDGLNVVLPHLADRSPGGGAAPRRAGTTSRSGR